MSDDRLFKIIMSERIDEK